MILVAVVPMVKVTATVATESAPTAGARVESETEASTVGRGGEAQAAAELVCSLCEFWPAWIDVITSVPELLAIVPVAHP